MVGWLAIAVKLLIVAVLVPVSALLAGFGFLKLLAHMQSRLGPMEAGGFHGWAQLVADGIKFIQKEDIIPAKTDRAVFALAPGVVLMGVILVFMTIPFGPDLNIVNLDAQIFVTLAVSSLGAIGVLMAGWSSANKYSQIGGFRAAGQLIAYELPLVLAVVGVVMQAGTLNLQGIVAGQDQFLIPGTEFPIPYLVPQIIGFLIFLVAAQAELAQAPFDMPVAESELVSGYATEYSGIRYVLFYLSEFAANVALAAIAATLFLGGYYIPFVSADVLDVIGPLVLAAKTAFLVFVFLWIRSTYPRLREDQLQRFAWTFLVPLALVNIGLTGLFKVVL